MTWIELKDNENYMINEQGELFSKKRKGGGGLLIKPFLEKSGYFTYTLWKNGKPSHHNLHRILAQCFIPNPYNLPCVDHIDRNRTNNNIENLRWVSYEENNQNTSRNTKKPYINRIIYKDSIYYRVYFYRNGTRTSKNCKNQEEAEKLINHITSN